ncbi:hypothetical protein [Panacibacter microcysteis]|nr:hypothetical protein [Panacibacter microcysteis]
MPVTLSLYLRTPTGDVTKGSKTMNIAERLLEDKVYSKAGILAVAKYACTSAERFEALMQCFLSGDYRLAQRAAWCLSWAAKMKRGMIVPHVPTLVAQLERKDVHFAVLRNSMRILEMINIPEALHGDVMNACFGFIEDYETPAAIKAFSLTTLFNLAKYYPEIKPELKLLIEDRFDNESAAFKSRAKKILQALNQA